MRILFITNVYPNPRQPNLGIFNAEMVRALAVDNEVQVIAPVSFVGKTLAKVRGATSIPPRVAKGRVTTHYPVFYYTPKILRHLYGEFMWRSIHSTVKKVIHSFSPDVVLAYWAHPDGAVALRAARQAGIPAVIMVGGSDVLLLTENGRRKRCIQDVLYNADAVVPTSRDLQQKLVGLGVSADKVHVVYRGVDEATFAPGNRNDARQRLGIPSDRRAVVWVGRMVAVKGLDVLLKAAELSKKRGKPFHSYLIGDGPLRQGLENEAARLGIADVFHFVSAVPHDQLGDWYRAADLTVLPSRSEGVPNVLRESLACGTPFVASNVGGIAEIAQEPMGRLVPPNDPAALSNTIELALKWPVGDASEAKAPQSWAASAEALMSVIRPLVAKSTGVAKARPKRLQWRQLLRSTLGWLFPRNFFLVRGPASHRSVCLTFDDGPHPEHTPRLLDVLKKHQVSATFFVIGEQALKHPELIRRIAAEGHVVGNHTFSHGEPKEVSTTCLLSEVRQTRTLLKGLVGESSNLFRPPKGELTPTKLGGLWRERQTVVLWNRDPKDYACQSSHELCDWFRANPLNSGDVVLMHDREPHAAVVLPDVIEDAKRRGLRFATIREWTS